GGKLEFLIKARAGRVFWRPSREHTCGNGDAFLLRHVARVGRHGPYSSRLSPTRIGHALTSTPAHVLRDAWYSNHQTRRDGTGGAALSQFRVCSGTTCRTLDAFFGSPFQF